MKRFKLNYVAFSLIIAMTASCASEGALLDDDDNNTTATSEISNEGIQDKEYFFDGKKITDENTIQELQSKSFGTVVIDNKAYIVNSKKEHDAIAFSGNDEKNLNKAARASKNAVIFLGKGYNSSNKQSNYALWHGNENYSIPVIVGHIGHSNGQGLNGQYRHVVKISQILSMPNRINIVNLNNVYVLVSFKDSATPPKYYSWSVGPKKSLSVYSTATHFGTDSKGFGGNRGYRPTSNEINLN
jgi:hypothetical protein